MERIIVDLSGIVSREGFWQCIRSVFECPEYFGDNLDAFCDVLSEMAGPTEIVFVNTAEFRKVEPEYFQAFDEMLDDIVAGCEDIYVSFEDYEA